MEIFKLVQECRYARWSEAPGGYAAAYCAAIADWCPVMARMYALQAAEIPIYESTCPYSEYFATQEGISAVQLQTAYDREPGAKNYFPMLVRPIQAEVKYEVLRVKPAPK